MEDIGTNITSTTINFVVGVPGHETSIGFVDVLLPDKRFSITTKIVEEAYILSNMR